uniref:Uncharacterized protein n=1 Tax=Rhizophagus irregularis (strain DAOM 181602 / DAOM 197198 / MUCL 43194) TaxID=747089 RepID=U9UPB5_RHIID
MIVISGTMAGNLKHGIKMKIVSRQSLPQSEIRNDRRVFWLKNRLKRYLKNTKNNSTSLVFYITVYKKNLKYSGYRKYGDSEIRRFNDTISTITLLVLQIQQN